MPTFSEFFHSFFMLHAHFFDTASRVKGLKVPKVLRPLTFLYILHPASSQLAAGGLATVPPPRQSIFT